MNMLHSITRTLKTLVQRLPLPLFFPVYRVWFWLSHDRSANRVPVKLGIPPLSQINVSRLKASHTVFILGSGASINHISAERWEGIRSHDTIALNNWLVHPFVPKFYCCDSPSPAPGLEFAYDFLLSNLLSKAAAYRDTIKIISNFRPQGERQISTDLSAECKHNLYTVTTPPVVARTSQEFRTMVRYYKARGLFNTTTTFDKLFKYNSILTTCLSLAVRLGYRNIVLCGVDLGTFEYFYHDPVYFPQTASVSVRPRDEKHDTTVAKPWLVPIDEMLMILGEEVLQPAGIQLFVENTGSLLYPRIPAAPDAVFATRPGTDAKQQPTEVEVAP